jgi:hypothetical protein
VWHVSVARINRAGDALIPVTQWPNNVLRQAKDLQDAVLRGVGGTDWQRDEVGESAIHRRRRLSAEEMRLLHQVNSQCPVFTHGKAMSAVLAI